MASGLKRDVDAIVRKLARPEYGCEVAKTKRGHWKVTKPGCPQVIISPDPCDPRTVRNTKADLKRYMNIVL